MPNRLTADKKPIYRHARYLHLLNYRDNRHRSTASDYLIAVVIGSIALLLCLIKASQIVSSSHLSSIVLLALCLPLIIITLHYLKNFLSLYHEAVAFANKAVAVADSTTDVESFFDATYPHIFWRKT